MKIQDIEILKGSLISGYLPADYNDVYSSTIKNGENITADDIQIAFWTEKPKWIERLFDIRNCIVKPFGLKSGKEEEVTLNDFKESIKNGTECGLASVPAKSANETVICLKDKHLNAYMSVFITEPVNNVRNVYTSTVVHFNNRLGYVYFYVIMPFHCIVVKKMMSYTLKKFTAEKTLSD